MVAALGVGCGVQRGCSSCEEGSCGCEFGCVEAVGVEFVETSLVSEEEYGIDPV